MKLKFLLVLSLAVFIIGCSSESKDSSPSGNSKVSEGLNSASSVKVTKWGPQGAKVGQPANPQPDGSSALWFEGVGLNKNVIIKLGDIQMEGIAVAQTGITASIPSEKFKTISSSAGSYAVTITDAQGKSLEIGKFVVSQ